ncbi:MAG: (4Fe-4S)-binding protein [Quinella sp. 2Q5]|nr:(4Fe-4S)-binding protein [Quinella sp. 2Q5]
MTKEILLDEKICVRCGACVSESEFGGVTFKDGKIFVDNSKCEDWAEIISICPTGALKMKLSDGKFSL